MKNDVFNAPVFLETIKQKIEKDHNLFVVMSILDFFILSNCLTYQHW